jgi:hypothetical protein
VPFAFNLKSNRQSVMMVRHDWPLGRRDSFGYQEFSMNKQALALLSLGHFLIDFCQGAVIVAACQTLARPQPGRRARVAIEPSTTDHVTAGSVPEHS